VVSEEAQAIDVLKQAGAVAEDDEQQYYEADRLLMGRPAAVKFTDPGDFVQGTVLEVVQVQARNFDTGDPEFWDDGSPKLQLLYGLGTVDGPVSLYVGSYRMRNAIADACRAAGARGIRRGGVLLVRFTGLGEPHKKGANPPKEYQAAYDPPAVDANSPMRAAPAVAARHISAACVDGNHAECDSRKCDDDCHRASRPPEAALLEQEAGQGESPF
jgi:hypothetical protein